MLLCFDQTLNRFIKRIRLNRSSQDKGRGNKGRDGSEGSFFIMTLIFFSVPLLHKQHHVPRNLQKLIRHGVLYKQEKIRVLGKAEWGVAIKQQI